MAAHENYGIDAPTVVRNLGLTGTALIACTLAPRQMPGASIAHALWPTGVGFLAAAAWMLASSLWFKAIVMRAMLAEREWRGNEKVLDVGCGRGLVAVAAAGRVPSGIVHGIDLWQGADLSANGPDGLLSNAQAAGVENRLKIETGDARALPYSNDSFDVVTSMTAIHNIPDAAGRQAAVAEAWRVLKPGGQLLMFDIRHARKYLRQVCQLGAVETRLKGPIFLWGPIGWRFTATKPINSQVRG
jgi:arsenite methyltransferase